MASKVVNKMIDFPIRGFLLDRRGNKLETPSHNQILLEKWGVKFGKQIDQYWQEATLPGGWSSNSKGYWHYVLDDLGRERASYFYKSASYDYDVFGGCSSRFKASVYPIHGVWEDHDAADVPVVTDGEKVIWAQPVQLKDAFKHSYTAGVAIANQKLVEMGLDKGSLEQQWDMPAIPFVVTHPQANEYRLHRLGELAHEASKLLTKIQKSRVTTGMRDLIKYRYVMSINGYMEPVECVSDEARLLQEEKKQQLASLEDKHQRIQNTIEVLQYAGKTTR